MNDVYGAWKPLRNYLSNVDINDALAVIRYYSARRSLRIPPPVPSDIELHPWADRDNSFLPWEMEALAREIIIISDVQSAPRYDLKKSHDIALAMNKMKDVENYIEGQSITQKNVYHDLTVRLSHRQFKYQTERPSIESMVRYSKIFGHPLVVPLVKRKTKLEPKQLFTLGAGLWVHFTTSYGMHYPLETLSLTDITDADYDNFVNMCSRPLAEMKRLLTDTSERHLDENFFYGYHSLYAYPLILTELNGRPTHVCPLPTLLYWRVTSGLYYDLYKENGFDNAFGTAFEEYVGSVFTKTYEGTGIGVYPGEPNTASSPKRCDWVIDQPNDCLIVECKTKRLTMGAKTSLLDDKELFAQLNILGEAITQAYLSLQAYRDGSYKNPAYTLDTNKKAYVSVTTLERWYLMGPQIEMLHEIVKEKVAEAGLDEAIIAEAPYVVMSVDDMEKVAYLAKTYSISEILQPYIDDQKNKGWEFSSYMFNAFKDELGEYEYVFDDDIKDTYTVELDMSKRGSKKRKDDKK